MVYMLTFGVLMGNVTIYSIHGSYGIDEYDENRKIYTEKTWIFDDDLRYNR